MSDEPRRPPQPARRARVPLWVTLLPLAAGVAGWFVYWSHEAGGLVGDLRLLVGEDVEIARSGFPYRLAARVDGLGVSHQDKALRLGLEAETAIANRIPWSRDRTVLSLAESRLEAALEPIAGARVTVVAPQAQASLRLGPDGRIARLSVVWQKPVLESGLFAFPLTATEAEAHLRETPATDLPSGTGSPRGPVQDQLLLSGRDVRFGKGDPLVVELEADVTADRPVRSLAAWSDGGTVEIRSLTLADPVGTVATIGLSLTAGDGRVQLSGTIETVCPASIRAAFDAAPHPSEKRLRQPVRLAFGGTLPGGVRVEPAAADARQRPVRAQQPPCPRLR